MAAWVLAGGEVSSITNSKADQWRAGSSFFRELPAILWRISAPVTPGYEGRESLWRGAVVLLPACHLNQDLSSCRRRADLSVGLLLLWRLLCVGKFTLPSVREGEFHGARSQRAALTAAGSTPS